MEVTPMMDGSLSALWRRSGDFRGAHCFCYYFSREEQKERKERPLKPAGQTEIGFPKMDPARSALSALGARPITSERSPTIPLNQRQ
jgi:hypothetical protein